MSISLLGSINVCKVNTGWADKIQSDRFENPNNMTCPLWNGQDNFGRFVHPDSFVTKNAGCNSAEDRVAVENFLRPQYMEYVALDAAGFNAPLYAGGGSNQLVEGFSNEFNNNFTTDAQWTRASNRDLYNMVGSAGYDYGKSNTPYDTGYRGVQGNGMGPGCGRRNGPARIQENFSYPQVRENYQYPAQDDMAAQMQNRHVANNNIQAYKSQCTKCSGGF
jgi:hypothetical protein